MKLSIFDFLAPEERARARDEVMPQVMRAGRWLGELKFCHQITGEIIPFLVDWFRIDDPRSGRPTNFATVSRDLRGQESSKPNFGVSTNLWNKGWSSGLPNSLRRLNG